MKRNDGNIACIIGPSHTVRWSWHIRDGVVKSDVAHDYVIGRGGAPIWSKQLFDTAKGALARGGKVGVMVGDFRFGNCVTLEPDHESLPLFVDNRFGIDAKAMTPELDREMLERGLNALKTWSEAFGDRVRFLFWDLFGRQIFDRLDGRYIDEGRYRHPVFNYEDITARVPRANTVDLAPILRMPMHEVRRLFIDSSCHPSQIGYSFLNAVLCGGREVTQAYREAVIETEAELFRLSDKIAVKAKSPVLVTGRSAWLDTLVGYLGESCLLRMARAGLVVAPIEKVRGQPSLEKILEEFPLDLCKPVVFSSEGRDISGRSAKAFGTDPAVWRSAKHIDWETATIPSIRARRETPNFTYGGGSLPSAASVITPTLDNHMVEQGPLGLPSWTGILAGFQCIEEAVSSST